MSASARAGIDQGTRLAAGFAEAACAGALALAGGMLVWAALAPESVVPAGDAPRAYGPAIPGAPRAAPDRSVLWQGNPFARRIAPQGEQTAAAAPETTLNLGLFGVAAGIGDAPGAAVIRTPDNRQTAFREGEEIIAGVILERVLADRVLISRDGAIEALLLPGAEAAAPAATAAAVGGAGRAPLTPTTLYDAMQFEPEMRDGRVAGLRISRAVDPAVLAAAGLAQGDLIVEVAGRPLPEVTDFADLFEDMRGVESLPLVVERGGAQRSVTISFEAPE